MKISIICTLFNRLSYLKMLMWNIFNYQDFNKSQLEFIVVDDGGSQDILSYLKTDYAGKNVQYIRTNRKARAGYGNLPAGRAIPTNLGVSFSKGEIILICDAEDFMLDPNHLSFFCENLEDPKQIAAANAMETLTIGELSYVRENYKNVSLIKKYIAERRNVDLSREHYFAGRHSGYWAQPREGFVSIGGFDERLIGLCGDDSEFNYRLRKLNYTYVPSPLFIVHNYHGENVGGPMRHWGDEFNNVNQYTPELKAKNSKFTEKHNEMGRIINAEQDSGKRQLKLRMGVKFYDDDIHIDLSRYKKEKQ